VSIVIELLAYGEYAIQSGFAVVPLIPVRRLGVSHSREDGSTRSKSALHLVTNTTVSFPD
jgi:hypothetical protein